LSPTLFFFCFLTHTHTHTGTLHNGICKISTKECLESTYIEDTKANIRVGPYAADKSYFQYFLDWNGVNISLSFSGGSTLDGVVEIVSAKNLSDYAFVVDPGMMWARAGTFDVSSSSKIHFEPYGLNILDIQFMNNSSNHLAKELGHVMAYPFSSKNKLIAFSSYQTSQDAITTSIASSLKSLLDRTKQTYGDLSEVKLAVTSGVYWNYVYVPTEFGTIFPVSRSWNFIKNSSLSGFNYVLFDWDNFFASFLASADEDAKNASYSNLIQIVKSRTSKGFVPNFSAGGDKSIDRTEPPVGAMILKEIYMKYKDDWIVELLFPNLLTWNDWFLRERTHGELGLISLGSDGFVGHVDISANAMQGARYESGLDNSPMYDGDFFQTNCSVDGPNQVGQMTLYDVGMNGMFAAESRALAYLAREVLKDNVTAQKLEQRANTQSDLIQKHLWHESDGIFTNRFWNSTFYARRSPTSFYAMMARASTDEQAERMMREWLLSPKHFCITENGDFVNNTDDCYWGLPSIEASDPAFPPLGYWRGYVWGPMAQLVYFSLREYDHVDIVRKSRKALCSQMKSLMLSQWYSNRHICENYNPHRNGTDCTGTKFYHWGALTGMISLLEEGLY